MDSRPPDANAMLEYASLRLLAGDSAGYKRLCARLVERYGDTSDLGIVDNLSRVCTLAPGAVDDPAWPVAWSEHIWMTRKPRPPLDPPFPRGRLLPRRPVRRGDPALPGVPAARPDLAGQCMNDVFLALAHARLGQLEEARCSLEKADQWLADANRQLAEKTIGFPPMVFPADWLVVQVLRREAAGVLAEPSAGAEGR